MKFVRSLLWIIVIAFIAGAVAIYLKHTQEFPSTDDAYVKAHVVQIAPQISGAVNNIYTQDHASVQKGQLLFVLDNKQEKIAVDQARAQLEQAIQNYHANQMAVDSSQAMVSEREAELKQAASHADRVLSLVKKKLYPPDEGDEAQKELSVAQAALVASQKQLQQAKDNLGKPVDQNAAIDNARAALEKANLDLSYTKVTAPATGYIANFTLRAGDQVEAYQELFAIVTDSEYWVEANFKETEISRIKPGQYASINLDMYPGMIFNGKVASISSGSGTSFSILPPENASGNWVKVTQRFPVKIEFINLNTKATDLRIGASAKVTIDARNNLQKK
jgi:membrane fusion protein (multidrug efflux system)